jgi:biopolymer transport protein ExbD
MAPELAMPKSGDYEKACLAAPSEFRDCFLPSYALTHVDKCKQARNAPLTSIEITPKDRAAPVDPSCGGFVSIYLDKAGTWLATGRDAKARCFAPRRAGWLDGDWLEAELRKVNAIKCPAGSTEVAADEDVAYQDIIYTMDISMKAGIVDVGISSPKDLAVPLAGAKPDGAARECPATVITLDPKDAAASRKTTQGGPSALANAPVLVITQDRLTLSREGTNSDLGSLSDAAKPGASLYALPKVLPKTQNGMLILQAVESTPSTVINKVVAAAKAQGYDNIMFAVKNR